MSEKGAQPITEPFRLNKKPSLCLSLFTLPYLRCLDSEKRNPSLTHLKTDKDATVSWIREAFLATLGIIIPVLLVSGREGRYESLILQSSLSSFWSTNINAKRLQEESNVGMVFQQDGALDKRNSWFSE
ncbi:hypothetical protein ANN_21342 [Periplaneta americana]|uniref:Uncharacterized protein n=1 Tax=Periplaneta americana TaxID=6978 RepID=A0ABQ8SG55_PERAM|nr:hypothetical protein ANN_21342 [Periplaneta americana]